MSKLQFHIIEPHSPAYDEMVDLRMAVLLAPIGIPRSYINPEKEAADILVGAYMEGVLVGCCILTKIDSVTIQLRQMAIVKTRQGSGIGRQILSFGEGVASENGFHTVLLHARDTVIPFYQKCGYSITGNQFFEVSIPHHKMQKRLLEDNKELR